MSVTGYCHVICWGKKTTVFVVVFYTPQHKHLIDYKLWLNYHTINVSLHWNVYGYYYEKCKQGYSK